MQGIAQPLSDADMIALGVYFSQQKPKNLTARDPQLVATGQTLYPRGRRGQRPARMRGVPFAQRAREFPRTSRGCRGSTPTTRYAQLKAFKAGERGNDAGGKDVDGRDHGGGRAEA